MTARLGARIRWPASTAAKTCSALLDCWRVDKYFAYCIDLISRRSQNLLSEDVGRTERNPILRENSKRAVRTKEGRRFSRALSPTGENRFVKGPAIIRRVAD
ncbi:hypothetical protein EVAR_30480_1 [Eumeta japonica]|uniref:Uncharacterized protein n=1 Tax=Eumeta variegata TaxID=151549 RepID=A0A4C1VXJ8_EUMVA|nr:hypothetical protein EVAR_30480_1 [Eumeta japonica]